MKLWVGTAYSSHISALKSWLHLSKIVKRNHDFNAEIRLLYTVPFFDKKKFLFTSIYVGFYMKCFFWQIATFIHFLHCQYRLSTSSYIDLPNFQGRSEPKIPTWTFRNMPKYLHKLWAINIRHAVYEGCRQKL